MDRSSHSIRESESELLTRLVELAIDLDQYAFGELDALGLVNVAVAISELRDNIG